MADDLAEYGHLLRLPGDADDTFKLSPEGHRQIDAPLNSTLRLVLPDGQTVQPLPDDGKRSLMQLTPAGGVRAGKNHAVFIHDVDVPVDGRLHLIDDVLRAFLGNVHGRRPPLFLFYPFYSTLCPLRQAFREKTGLTFARPVSI